MLKSWHGPRGRKKQLHASLPAQVRWRGLPFVEQIASCPNVLSVNVDLPYSPEEYCQEADALRMEFPEAVWHRDGKPDKICFGPRSRPEDWSKFDKVSPRILETADHLLRSFPGQNDVEVSFGDVLDYRCTAESQLLGWHQDNMDLTRHTFTIVLTLFVDGDGRFEWREISPDGKSLRDVVASSRPQVGEVAVHGLTCNNALAHRAFWDVGRRVALVLFCRSQSMQTQLRECGLESRITMRHWWSKTFETTK